MFVCKEPSQISPTIIFESQNTINIIVNAHISPKLMSVSVRGWFSVTNIGRCQHKKRMFKFKHVVLPYQTVFDFDMFGLQSNQC